MVKTIKFIVLIVNVIRVAIYKEVIMTRESTRYNTIVGVKDGEIFVLEETFKYSDNFEGAVGYSMRPLTQDDIDT